MDEEEFSTRLGVQLEGQKLLESKILLQKLYAINDVTKIIESQWLPLTTSIEFPGYSRAMALVESTDIVGYGSVLLHQPSVENLSIIQDWVSKDLLITINIVIDGSKVCEAKVVAENDITPSELSRAAISYLKTMGNDQTQNIGHALTTVSRYTSSIKFEIRLINCEGATIRAIYLLI